MPRSSRAPAVDLRVVGLRVLLRPPTEDDATELMALRRESWEFLRPWEPSPPKGRAAHGRPWFRSFLEQAWGDDRRRFLIRSRETDAILGSVSLSGIVRGVLQGAWLGYWLGAPHTGRGHATEGVDLCLRYAFRTLKLHRIEANVRPENEPSKGVLRRLGFRQEGYSPSYLKIAGRWCDHERWAILDREWRPREGSRTS